MTAGPAPESYKDLMLFLATAGVVVPLFHRLRISPVLGFLGAGALLGPYGLGQWATEFRWLSWVTIASRDEIAHLAEFGVVFLLFTIGIELSWSRLRTLRRLVFGLGSLQVACSTAAVAGLVYPLVNGPTTAILIGIALALSSTAIVVPVLAERRRLTSPAGRASFSVLLFQDLAVAPVLFTVTVLGAGTSNNMLASLVWALGQAVVAVAVIFVIGRLALRPLFQLVAATRSPELFMAASLLVVVASGLFAAVSGLSMPFGAFMAGLLLAETEYRRAIEAMIEPFKGLLLGVFFVSVGLGLDATRVIEQPVPILTAAVLLVAVKTGLMAGLARLLGLSRPVALETALLLGPAGEFAFVIMGSAVAAGLVPARTGQSVLLVATLTMLAIPILARMGRRWSRRIERAQPIDPAAAVPPPADEVGRVLVAGYGRVGQVVADMLTRHQVSYLAMDADPVRVAAERRAGHPVYYGDSTSPEFLRACGVERARALVVTLDQPTAIEAVVAAARSLRPDLTIVARARDARHASRLYEIGVDDAVPETIEASLQLSEAVLVDIGIPMGLVIASVHERREDVRALLKNARSPGGGTVFQGRRRTGTGRG